MNEQREGRAPSRRDALKGAGRLLAGACLSGAVIRLMLRDPGRCRLVIPCASCGKLMRCDLPPARDERARRRDHV